MIWRNKDENRWRYRFALFPMTIGDRRVWLSRYAWRPLPEFTVYGHRFRQTFQEWSLPDGYTIIREIFSVLGGRTLKTWVRDKPTMTRYPGKAKGAT